MQQTDSDAHLWTSRDRSGSLAAPYRLSLELHPMDWQWEDASLDRV